MSRARDTADQINRINSSAANATAITVDSSENVGILNSVASTIATANSRNGLVVGSGSGNNGVTVYSGSTSNSSLFFADSTTGANTYIGQVNYDHNADAMSFATTAAERIRIDSDGLKFNGDTAAANALSDYEEGTWTPAFEFTNGGTVTHGSRAGVYTKIGKIVLASFNIRTTGVSGVSGELQLSGLPFTVQSTGIGGRTGGSQGFSRNWGADMPNFRIYSFPGQSKLLFYYNAMNGGTQQVGSAQFSTGGDSNVAEWSIVYFTEQ